MNAGDDVLVFPQSPGQRQLWYLQRLAPESTAYNIPFAVEIEGELRVHALVSALEALVARHEALRTTYGVVDGVPSQLVHHQVTFPVSVDDGRGLAEEAYETILRTEATTPFDLRSDLPIRVRILQRGDRSWTLLWTMHHIAVDHIAVVQLGEQLAALYSAGPEQGAHAEPSGESLQYIDYTMWQLNELRQEGAIESRLSAWGELLSGSPHVLELPLDRQRPATQSFHGAELRARIDSDLRDLVLAASRSLGASSFVFMLTAFKVAVGVYSGRNDVITGCPFANRTRPELENVVGLFMNLLPIRVEWGPEATVRELVGAVRAAVTTGQRYQDTPFEKIVEATGVRPTPAVSPLVQTWFTLQEPPLKVVLPGAETVTRHPHNGGSKLDLSCWWWDTGECLEGSVEYDVALFDEITVQRFLGTFEWILRQMAENPEAAVGSISVCPPSQHESVHSWQGAEADDGPRTLQEGLRASFAAHGSRWAIRDLTERVTFGDLELLVEGVASALLNEGVGPTDRVGICLPRTADMVVAALGVWSMGAAYVPLDPEYPVDRLRYFASDSGLRLVLADDATKEIAEGCGCQALLMANARSAARTTLSVPPEPGRIAYVVYTSGSTGAPKGVQVSHRAVANLLTAMASKPGCGPDDVVAAVTTMAFDISVLELFLPIWVGAECAIIGPDETRVGDLLADRLGEFDVSILQATPGTWRLLIETGQRFPGVRALVGGEPLPADVVQGLEGRVDEVWNMYGPTETTVWSTCTRVDGDTEPTIGRPILNTTVRVTDSAGRRLPIGATGEIWIGGHGLSAGYLGNPELTAARFVTLDGATWYKTGDLGRWTQDGRLRHLGRLDRQIKLRGFRIEPGEVEAALTSLPGVSAAVVSTHELSAGDVRLVAHVVSDGDAPPTSTELRRSLRSALPRHMIPSIFVPIGSFPTLPNGKVDYDSMPVPAIEASPPRATEPLRPGMETDMADVWRDLLRLSSVGPDDNFFDLGGHSLLAMEAVAVMQVRAGIQVEPRSLFFQTLRQLATTEE